MNNGKLNPCFTRLPAEKTPMISGDDCVQLCWADPCFPSSPMPGAVKSAILSVMDNVGGHYTPPAGLPELRRAAADKIMRKTGVSLDPEKELIIVPGADTGLYYAMLLFLVPGDEVLIPSPSYSGNAVNAGIMGATAVPVLLDEKKDYELELEALEEAVTDKTKMIVLTNPNNPTGRCYSRDELEMLADFAVKHDLMVVVDQAFEDTVFKGYSMITLSTLPEMKERTVTVYSLSKGYGLCGFRVGYITAPEKYMSVMQRYAVNVLGATNTIAQYGALAALKDESISEKMAEFFEKRTLKTWEILSKINCIHICRPQAGFYLWVDVSALGGSQKVLDFCEKKAHVCLSPGDSFGYRGTQHVRIITAANFDDDIFYAAVYRIRDAFLELQKGQFT